jgi:biopolymer transport protein ExbD
LNPNLIAAVKTDPNAPYKHMIDVLDALQAAQADKISLQILE